MNGVPWNHEASAPTMSMLSEVINAVKERDPVQGIWTVNQTTRGTVWCDASSLAIGVALEINTR
jgi:hypothetical protein